MEKATMERASWNHRAMITHVVSGKRVLLIDPRDARREVLARRLRAQGCIVEESSDAASGADAALASPPAAVIADLWMPSISGVQLCRLLRSEPATMDVPVILCGDGDEPRNRFWAERAGVAAYVVKGRTGELVRAVTKAVAASDDADGFFVQLSGGSIDIRDRIARHLDEALFESVIASELRALASSGTFERLFDLLAQVTRSRGIALATRGPERMALHHHPSLRGRAEAEAKTALGLGAPRVLDVEDEDAVAETDGPAALVLEVPFANAPVALFAMGPTVSSEIDATQLARLVARELGGAVKMTSLIEDSQRLAATDALTGLMNRRAFTSFMAGEITRSTRYDGPLSLLLLDIDHFKQINDRCSHASGDRVLAALGELLPRILRECDRAARWGGEEFVVGLTGTDRESASEVAERLRSEIAALQVLDDDGARIPVTASIGVATWSAGELLESLVARADRAMYVSKASGRNRVSLCAASLLTASSLH
jgi:two-component system cell cycle response regulator